MPKKLKWSHFSLIISHQRSHFNIISIRSIDKHTKSLSWGCRIWLVNRLSMPKTSLKIYLIEKTLLNYKTFSNAINTFTHAHIHSLTLSKSHIYQNWLFHLMSLLQLSVCFAILLTLIGPWCVLIFAICKKKLLFSFLFRLFGCLFFSLVRWRFCDRVCASLQKRVYCSKVTDREL